MIDEYDEDCDDSPQMTAQSLTNPNGPYQTVVKATQTEKLSTLSVDLIYEAVHDVITSNDESRSEALDYLLSSGIPFHYEQKLPIGVLAALQPNTASQYHLFVRLKLINPAFLEETDTLGRSAVSILRSTNPSLLEAVNHHCIRHYYHDMCF
jgi:hypothetical protein